MVSFMATVIFVLLVVVAGMAIGWKATVSKVGTVLDKFSTVTEKLVNSELRCAALEAEIRRLRQIPLTQPPEKRDNSTIKAKSSADVRRLTEAAFGLQPEIGASNEDE